MPHPKINPMTAKFTVRPGPETLGALNAWQLGKIEVGAAAADRDDFATDEELARVRAKLHPCG